MSTAVLVVSSCATASTATRRHGVSLYQLGSAHGALAGAGWEVEVASPMGGAAPLDASTLSESWMPAQALARDTIPLSELRAQDFDAWLVLGGYGALYDLAADVTLQRTLAKALLTGRVVAATDHGCAALSGIAGPDGRPLVQGRRVTGRSDREERQARHREALTRSTEQALRRSGGLYSSRRAWQPHIVVDDRLITGQNPRSTIHVANAVMSATIPVGLAA